MPCRRHHVGQGRHHADGAGVVEGDVEAAEPFQRQIDKSLCIGFVPDVAGKRNGGAVRVRYFGDERVELCLAPRGDDELRAFLGKEFCGSAADAGTGAGDDGDLVGECEHFLHPLLGASSAGDRMLGRKWGWSEPPDTCEGCVVPELLLQQPTEPVERKCVAHGDKQGDDDARGRVTGHMESSSAAEQDDQFQRQPHRARNRYWRTA